MKQEQGFTIFELLGALVIFSFVSFALFSTILSLKDDQQIKLMEAELVTYQTSLATTVMNDLDDEPPHIINICMPADANLIDCENGYTKTCGDNDGWVNFKSNKYGENKLEYNICDRQMIYNGIPYQLPDDTSIRYLNYLKFIEEDNQQYLSIDIGISHLDLFGDFGFKMVYQLDESISIDNKPLLWLEGKSSFRVYLNEEFITPDFVLEDDVDDYATLEGLLTSFPATIDTSSPGTQTVTYFLDDSDGNSATPVEVTILVLEY